MSTPDMISLASKVLAMTGLAFDMFGIYKLFNLEPEPLNEADTNIFENSFPGYTKEEQISHIARNLNSNIAELKYETKTLRRQSKSWFIYIIIGFAFQFLSVVLSLFL